MKLKVFSQKFVGMVGFPAISPNIVVFTKIWAERSRIYPPIETENNGTN